MIYLSSHKGAEKNKSDDSVLIGSQIFSEATEITDVPEEAFICVADGVGGNNAGDEASTFVLKALSESVWEGADSLRERLQHINEELIERGKENRALNDMATTLSGLYIKEGEMNLVHVGNTRIYTMQGRYLKQLTADHTVYNWLKSLGRIEEADACNKNEITSCFGGGDAKLLEKLQINPVNFSKTLLITSDGIHEYVSIDELEEIINSDIPNDKKCDAMIEAARDNGSADDATSVLIYLP